MNIIAVYWKDATEHKDGIASNSDTEPLLYLLQIGIDGGQHKDNEGFEYLRVIYKKAIDGSIMNDDFIDIPTGCIIKTEKLCEL